MTDDKHSCGSEGCEAPATFNLQGGNEIHLCDEHAHELAHMILVRLIRAEPVETWHASGDRVVYDILKEEAQ